MLRRGFLKLASAAVLGVLTAKVPVFTADISEKVFVPVAGEVSMWVYPTMYALPTTISGEFLRYTERRLTAFRALTSAKEGYADN